jgi:hypothetical protein
MTTKQPFTDSQTPAQRKAHEADVREHDAVKRVFNNVLGFWLACGKARCRRNNACSGDPHACFQQLWPLVPEQEKEYVRGCITASKVTRSPQALHQAGVAARDACLKRMESVTPPAAARDAARPVREVASDPEIRVRRL